MLGKIEGGRRRGWQRMRWLDSITDSMDRNLSKRTDISKSCFCSAITRRGRLWMALGHRTAGNVLCRWSPAFSPGHQFIHYIFVECAPGPVLTAVEVEMWFPILGFMMLLSLQMSRISFLKA